MFGGLNTMWIIVMFDLPTEDKQMRKDYTKFRKFLLNDGFAMMQYSVYMRLFGYRSDPNIRTEVRTALISPSLTSSGILTLAFCWSCISSSLSA